MRIPTPLVAVSYRRRSFRTAPWGDEPQRPLRCDVLRETRDGDAATLLVERFGVVHDGVPAGDSPASRQPILSIAVASLRHEVRFCVDYVSSVSR